MRVALVHDYLKEYGGAERVLEALHEIWPDAPVYTSVYLPQYLGPHRERFRDWDIRESWVKNVPFREKLISPLRILSPFIFRSFDFTRYDLVIVSATGAYFPNTIRCHPEFISGSRTAGNKMLKQVQHDKGKGPVHICYCHTPPRYLYGYATAREWKKNWVIRVIGEIANHFLRIVDFNAAQQVDHFIANSEEVRSRIKKFYRKDATVIYPPVEVEHRDQSLEPSKNSKLQALTTNNYYLAGGRLARPKNIDLIVKTFTKNKLPLKIFGKPFGGYEEEIRDKQQEISSNIEFVGEITDEEKYELMRNAKAYIFASLNEDFGITPVEAMSTGTPVIAYKGGGVMETVVEGKTGIFFDELSEESLLKAIKKLEKLKIQSEECVQHAQKFSKERFKTEMQLFVSNVYGVNE